MARSGRTSAFGRTPRAGAHPPDRPCDSMQADFTFDDPKAYTKPWTGQLIFKLRTGWHLMEYICEDHMEEPTKR